MRSHFCSLFIFLAFTSPLAAAQPPAPPLPAASTASPLDQLTALAESGDDWSMWLLYLIYADQIYPDTPPTFDLPKDKRPLWDLARAAANARNHDLAPRTAITWLKRAADAGNLPAIDDLGFIYETGWADVPKDTGKAAVLIQAAIDRSSYASMIALGRHYQHGDRGVEKDQKKATDLFNAAALILRKRVDAGDARAKVYLAQFHRDGLGGIAKDTTRALDLYTQAANEGDASAMGIVGYLLFFGKKDFPKDEPVGINWIRKAADRGESNAMYYLAMLVRDEKVSDIKPTRAIALLRRAAERDSMNARFALAQAYEYGMFGLTRNHAVALDWYRRAADADVAAAIYELGYFAYYGKDQPRDLPAAAKFLRRAADLDIAEAMVLLAHMHRAGEGGLERSDAKAVALLQKAVEAEDMYAMSELADMYDEGAGGLAKDPAKAEALLKSAAAKGYEEAKRKLETRK